MSTIVIEDDASEEAANDIVTGSIPITLEDIKRLNGQMLNDTLVNVGLG